MPSPSLTVRALGPLTDLLDAAHAGKWKYLQSPELLLYLVCETETRGKTRAQIETALPIPSSEGSDDNFQARYREVRQRLGSEWVVTQDGKYRFNFALPFSFDVREFEQRLEDAHRLTAAAPEQAIPLFQQALALYRGDFMEGHTTRRSARSEWDADEREWYLVKREQLRAARYDALQQLSALLFDARRYHESVEINRLLVAELDDDDDAHYRLLYALGAQGLRSDALRHFKQLRAQRADDTLDPKLAALVAQIKRGELADAAPVAPAFAVSEKIPPPFQVPAELARFVGRAEQFEILQTVVSLQSPISSLCLVGMGGIGKTSLAIHAAYRLREQFPDGVLWGNLRESEPLAILASWERAYGCDFSSLPDLNARAASFRSLMHDKRVLVILDDVTDAAGARPLLLNGAQTRTIFTTRSADITAALDAFAIEMPVLDADESADLLTRILGNARVAGQEMFANEICRLLGHLPLALEITAQRLISRPTWSLREMAERLRAQLRRLDELQLADRAVRATFALSWDALNDAQKNVLAHVGVFDARSFTADALAYVANVDAPDAREILDALVALSLLSFESNTRYRQHPLLADFSLEKLDDRQRAADSKTSSTADRLSSAQARLAQYYRSFATTNRKNYLALEDEWDNLNVGIEIAHAQELWQAVIAYGDVLTDAWFARGRFSDARHNYPYVMRAARELEEQDPYIAASLNWGKACIDQGDYAEAQEHLQHGLQTSREVNDEFNIATALFLLGRVAVERSEYAAAQKYLEESQATRERIGDRAGVAETLYLQARILYMLGQFSEASVIAAQTITMFESLEPSHAFIVTLRWCAAIATKQKNYAHAKSYLERALSYSQLWQETSEYAATLNSLSILYWHMQQFDTAIAYAKHALPLMRAMGDRRGMQYVLEQLCLIAMSQIRVTDALDYGRQSIEFAQELGDTSSIVRVLVRLGDIQAQHADRAAACQIWQEALERAEKIQHPLAGTLQQRLSEQCSDETKNSALPR